MKFSSLAVLAVVAPFASGFAPVNPRQTTAFTTSLQKSKSPYDLDGLDQIEFPKPFSTPAPEEKPKKAKAKKAKEPEPTPTPVPPKPEPVKSKKKSKKEAPAPAPTPDTIAAKIESLKPKPASKPTKPVPKPPAPKPVAKTDKDPNAVPLGLALGGAPLLLAPIVALGAGRDLLSKTQARRAEIQKEIEEYEEAQKQKKLQAEVDGTGITTALVSI